MILRFRYSLPNRARKDNVYDVLSERRIKIGGSVYWCDYSLKIFVAQSTINDLIIDYDGTWEKTKDYSGMSHEEFIDYCTEYNKVFGINPDICIAYEMTNIRIHPMYLEK